MASRSRTTMATTPGRSRRSAPATRALRSPPRAEPSTCGSCAADAFGPLEAVATPGHAPDHLAYITGTAALTGDAVLGEGSVFVAPDPGALAGYLEALVRLRERPLTVLLPGHGPPVFDPQAKLDEYVSHRLDRETRLVLALEAGKRTTNDLLDDVWSDVPAGLGRPPR